MRKILLAVASIAAFQCLAQPVISDASNVPAVGFSATLLTAPCLSAGSAGASQTWDFSSLTFTGAGMLNVVDPSITPFASTYPTANWCYTISGAVFTYFENTSTQMINWASTISSTGGNGDYAANPKTIMQFPWSYGNTFSDTYIESGSTNSVTVTYDGYGTLIMPGGYTYTNVVRVKESYGSEDDYRWYTTSPLLSVAVFSVSDNTLFWVQSSGSEVKEEINLNNFAVFPNPANNTVQIEFANENAKEIKFYAIDGQLVHQVQRNNVNNLTVDVSFLPAGVYTVQAGNFTRKLVIK